MIFIVALALCARVAMSQPSSCSANSHCNEGYFCELSVYQCLPCLRCEDYKRAAPAHTTLCTTSVSQCGGCLPGLVEDGSGNLEAACVTSSLLWILLGVAAVIVLFGGVLIYLLRKTETLKILTSATRTSVQPSALCADPERAGAPPPPYNAAYSPVRATSPPPDAPPAPRPAPPAAHAWPEPLAPPAPRKRAPDEPASPHRVADASQAARVYNYPHYVRGPELPPSYESSEESPVLGVDEDTMESVWSPAPDLHHNTEPSSSLVPKESGAVSAAAAAARDGPPAKLPRISQQDNNNNGGGSSSSSGGGEAAPLTFNIIVQQHNDLKLIRT